MPTTPPASTHGHDAPDQVFEKCTLHDAGSIRELLQRLIERRCVMSASAEGASEGMVTAVLALDACSIWIDAPRDERLLQRLLVAPRLMLRGALDQVRLHFSCGPARLGDLAELPALVLPLPEQLLHLQRRELLRHEPSPESVRCMVHPRNGDPPVEVTIRDIGGGGLALLVPEDGLALAAGDLLPRCVIELPKPFGTVEVALCVRHVRQTTRRGKSLRQAGCEFVDPSGMVQARLFRYVMQLDRDQRAAEKRLFD
ncbi:flagellar brake protein [Luteimonas notoginsengisoli]|jgi:c-di-GMP-binding flagellar brake protein YcgR|uniref:Flagellar brake protein n=1 Tax=Luteimonas notoginsengisoli TaxID=1578200 RepID=A0ABV7UQQ3_9GAMM